jgi:hypothetical protein
MLERAQRLAKPSSGPYWGLAKNKQNKRESEYRGFALLWDKKAEKQKQGGWHAYTIR